MDVLQQMIEAIYAEETLKKVKASLINNSTETNTTFESNEISFRLKSYKIGFLNLEVLTQESINTKTQNNLIDERIMYFKPMCVYQLLNDAIKIVVVNEFKNQPISNSLKPIFLSTEENLVIAAFSKTVAFESLLNKEKEHIDANGMKIGLYETDQGYLQSFKSNTFLGNFMDDMLLQRGPIAAYILESGNVSINPGLGFEREYNKLLELGLLSFTQPLI